MVRSFSHQGDLGDVVAALAAVKAMGGGRMVLCAGNKGCRESLEGARYEALKPLLEAQPYISRVEWSSRQLNVDHDFSTFRNNGFVEGENLANWQAKHLNVSITMEPWLLAFRSGKSIGRPVIARSARYQNPEFPWNRIVMQKHRDPLFVGLPEEHKAFEAVAGMPVEYAKTSNLLELAEIISGASVFLGNQSCPFWIAAGLGVPLIQETSSMYPNSVVLRPNATYIAGKPYDRLWK